MNIIPEQSNLLEQIGSFMGSKIVDAAAVASAIVILRSGVRDPKIIGGAFALYAVAKKDGQLMGQLAGKSFDLYLKDTFNVDVDQYINKNINQINQIIDTYFDISKKHQTDDTPTTQTQTTIYETASKLNTTVSKLEQSNPWLKSRSSDNLSTIFKNSSNKSLLVQDNTGISYTYTYNSSSDTFENQTPIATADDAINFIANFDGTMSDLQNIQNAVKDAYENHGLSKEYYDAFMESFNTYVKVNTQNNNVTTQPTGNSTRIDKNAFYYYKNINDTALSLANKTFTVLDSNNNSLSVQDLKLLDINSDKQLSGSELINLKAWIDANENGIVDSGEINTLSANNISIIEEIDYAMHGSVKGNVIYKDAANDTIYIQNGNYVVYSNAGNDWIRNNITGVGNSAFYGGAGNDTIEGGNNNDYLDGGTGADLLKGGLGDDVYIVNSINDDIKEYANGGNDTVYSSVNHILEKNIETLRLIEGFNISGTGNGGNNTLIGNSANNILNGLNGNDTMIGGLGDDAYYVDSMDDVVIEKASSGNDTINSYVTSSLSNLQNVENIQLLDFLTPEFGNINGKDVYVYGHPQRVELDYSQGDAVSYKTGVYTEWYRGTCSLVAISNLLSQSGRPISEADVVNLAIEKKLTTTTGAATVRGGTTRTNQIKILKEFGVDAQLFNNNQYNPDAIAQYILSGRGVLVAVNAGQLWGDKNTDDGSVDHVVLVSGVVYDTSGNLNGFYIADSGRGESEDTNRYLSLDEFKKAVSVPDAYFIYTNKPILDIWNKDINAVGNDINNILYGNSGNNELYGRNGDDILIGGQGDDYVDGGYGNDTYKFSLNDGKDILFDIAGNDNIIFSDIKRSEIKVVQIGDNLVIYGINSIGSLTIQGWFSGNKIEKISFSDGNLSIANIESLVKDRYIQGNYQLGTIYNNQIIAANKQNQIEGGAGNDIIKGGFESDVLKGDIGDDTIYGLNGKDLIYGGNGEDLLSGGDDSDLIFGGTGNDTLQGGMGNDIIEGEDGNDLIYGDDGDDLIYAGAGNDRLFGQGGDDSYYFARGEGNDIIFDTQGCNKIIFTEGITQSNIAVKRDNNNLLIVLNTGEILTIDSWYVSNKITLKPIQEFIFADGTKLDASSIEKLSRIVGTSGNDSIVGTLANDNIYGLDGDDYIYAKGDISSNDFIDGGEGNDKLSSLQNGNTTLYGNVGDDTLNAGTGNDTFIFGLGDGNDILSAYDVDNNTDIIFLKKDITLQTLNIIKDDKHLILKTSENDSVSVNGFFSSYVYSRVDKIVFEDGTILNYEQIAQQTNIKKGTKNNDLLSFSDLESYNGTYDLNYEIRNSYGLDNTLYGFEGNDTLYGGSGNDILDGGIGNDILRGVAGDDKYVFGLDYGNDIISDSEGNNSIYFLDGIKTNNISVTKGVNSNDLLLLFNENTSSITIRNWYNPSYPDSKIKQFIFADGTILDSTAIEQMKKIIGTSNDDVLYGTNTNDFIYGKKGNDFLLGGEGNDVYIFNLGDGKDTIIDSKGADTIRLMGKNFNADNIIVEYLKQSTTIKFKDNLVDSITYESNSTDAIKTIEVMDENNILFKKLLINTENIAPKAFDDTVMLSEDISAEINILINDTDENGHKIAINSYTQPLYGTVIKNENGTFTYTSNQNYYGADSFMYTIIDSLGLKSTSAIVTITINPVNDKPILDITKINIMEDSKILNGTIKAIDVDSTILTYLTTATVDGFILNSNGTYIFNPAHNVYQSLKQDEIKTITIPITVSDGSLSDSKNLVITITGTNDKPTVITAIDNYILNSGATQTGNIGASDIDKDILSYTISIAPTNGTITIDTNGNWKYIAKSNYAGNDKSIVTISDGKGESVIKTLNFNMQSIIYGTSENDYLYGTTGADRLIGLSGNDTYVVDNVGDIIVENLNEESDTVNSSISYTLAENVENLTLIDSNAINGTGNNFNNAINGNSGANTLDGGAGNDYLYGNNGNDTYLFGKGDGEDCILDSDYTIGNVDTVKFKSGVSSSEVVVTRSGDDIFLSITGTQDKVILYSYFNNDNYKIEKVQFADGTVWDSATLVAKTNVGTNENDYLVGTIGADRFVGGLGNDTYMVNNVGDVIVENANEGTDIVISNITYSLVGTNLEYLILRGTNAIDGTGNELDNYIDCNNSNNTLDGRAGNDILYGYYGNDTYLFGKGYGKDYIVDYDSTIGNVDTVMFKTGVSSSEVVVTRDSNNINLSIKGTQDTATIANYFANDNYKIEKVQLSDGNYLSSTDIDKLIQSMSAYASTKGISLSNIDSVSKNTELMTMIASSWHK